MDEGLYGQIHHPIGYLAGVAEQSGCQLRRDCPINTERQYSGHSLIRTQSFTHRELIELAGENLHMKTNKNGQHLAIFSISGALIIPTTEWTLNNYLKKIHKSDARLE